MKRESIWIRLVRPPFLAIGFVFTTIYAGLFGWWLDALISKKNDERLANEVKQDLPFLFSEKGGKLSQATTIGFNAHLIYQSLQLLPQTSGFGSSA